MTHPANFFRRRIMAAIQEKNDVKIFILYILGHIGYPIDYASLTDLVLGGGVVRYFDFVECFGELVDDGSILRCDREATGEYRATEKFEITARGKELSEVLSSELASYIRDKSLKRTMQYLSFKKDGTHIHFDTEPLYDERSKIKFCLTRDDGEIFRLEFISDNERMTERVRMNVDYAPEDIYKSILSIITGDSAYLFGEQS